MPLRPPSGFIRPGFDPLKNPNAPTIGTATGGDASASVAFTPPSNVGGSAISSYTAISTPDAITASAASSPISVTGLTNGTAYTFAVWATNTYGPSAFSAASGSVTPNLSRALFAGGQPSTSGTYNVIDYADITTLGNATDFGDLTIARTYLGACSSLTRGVFAGGTQNEAPYGSFNRIDYVTISTTGNATTFGSLDSARNGLAGCSNSTRGIFSGGFPAVGGNVIQYITIASTGNATDFGDMGYPVYLHAGASSTTRGVFAYGDNNSGFQSFIEYITIASTGNAANFGDTTQARYSLVGLSSATRSVFGGGNNNSTVNTIDYVTTATTGNATDFGDLTGVRQGMGGASSLVRGLFGGGYTGSNVSNVIDYITIATTGNASDFGDLTISRRELAGCSNCHGGL